MKKEKSEYERLIVPAMRADRALIRGLTGTRNQLSWLIDFALREDLTELNKSKRHRLWWQLYYFCRFLGGLAVPSSNISGEKFKKLASEARWLLGAPGRGPRAIDLRPKLTLIIGRDEKTGALKLEYDGKFVELWPLLVASLVAQHGDLVRACRLEDCGKPFLIKKRQQYCTDACAQRDRTRRYRGNLKPAERKALSKQIYIRGLLARKKVEHARKYLRLLQETEPEVAKVGWIAELIDELKVKRVKSDGKND